MVSSLYLSRGSFDFNEIWSSTADFGSKDGHVTKYQNFANSKWRTAAILKSFFDNISTINCPINVKLIQKVELRSDTDHVTKIPKYENSRWRTTAILKMVSSLYLSCGSSDFNFAA